MENSLRFALLSELSGNREYLAVKDYSKVLKASKAYQVLGYNVEEAKKHRSAKAQALVYSYQKISLEPNTVKDAFIMETALNYLALHSYPEYYLNPLAIDPTYHGEISTIGELVIDYKGKEASLNSIILDSHDSMMTKELEVDAYLNDCLSDMNGIVGETLTKLHKRAFQEEQTHKDIVSMAFSSLFFVLTNLALLFLLCYPFSPFLALFQSRDPGKVMTYVAYLYPLITLLYDFFFVFYHSYKANLSEPYNFARRFSKKNSSSIYQDVLYGKEQLKAYLFTAIETRTPLSNDLTEFSKLSSSSIDFEAIQKVEEQKKSRLFRFLTQMSFSLTILELTIAVVSFLVYVLGLVFKVAF